MVIVSAVMLATRDLDFQVVDGVRIAHAVRSYEVEGRGGKFRALSIEAEAGWG
jgi:hypothetical protein